MPFSKQFCALLTVFYFNVSVVGQASASADDDDDEVEIVYVREPTAEQAALAKKLLLPLTFFCYQNEPGYASDDETDGEI